MTSLNIVAHPDDDLLFLNPDIAEDEVVHIIYLTSGDDGRDREYIRCREMAARTAWGAWYDWSRFSFLEVKSSCFRLGDVEGDLYRMWHDKEYEAKWSLAEPDELYYVNRTRDSLLGVLDTLIAGANPDLIRIHNPNAEPALDHDEPHLDHVDHIYSAKFALEAAKQFPHIPVYAYMGYPIRYTQPNLNAHQVELKTKMWRAYQSVDTSVAGEQWDIALSRCYKEKIQ